MHSHMFLQSCLGSCHQAANSEWKQLRTQPRGCPRQRMRSAIPSAGSLPLAPPPLQTILETYRGEGGRTGRLNTTCQARLIVTPLLLHQCDTWGILPPPFNGRTTTEWEALSKLGFSQFPQLGWVRESERTNCPTPLLHCCDGARRCPVSLSTLSRSGLPHWHMHNCR